MMNHRSIMLERQRMLQGIWLAENMNKQQRAEEKRQAMETFRELPDRSIAERMNRKNPVLKEIEDREKWVQEGFIRTLLDMQEG